MKHTPIAVLIAFAIVAWAACGSGSDGARVAQKPRGEIGGETLVFPASTALPEEEGVMPSPNAIELRAYNVSPVGPISERARADYRIYLEVENIGDAALRLTPSFVRAMVLEDGELVSGCMGEILAVRDRGAIGTSGALFVSVPLPCALEAGDYEIDVTFSVGAPPNTDDVIATRSLRTTLVVDDALPPYATGFLPPE